MSHDAWQRIETERPVPERVLVLGSTGMVGRAWCELLRSEGIEYTAAHRPGFDLGEPTTIEATVNGEYDLVVNAAAWTDVDGAENDEAGAHRANAEAVQQIAELCTDMGSLLITYSTDYVFDGSANSPYGIAHPIAPINAYGRSKAAGESMLRSVSDRHILIRTSRVHAPWGKNFVLTMKSLTSSKEELRVVNDQRGRPSSAKSIAAGSLKLYTQGALGTWHLTDSGECTWHELACQVRDLAGATCTIHTCGSDEFPRPAKRPGYSTLDISSTEALIGRLPSWEVTAEDSVSRS